MPSLTLFSGPCSPQLAEQLRRQLETRQVQSVVPPLVRDDLSLAATELVSNACKAGANSVDVTLVAESNKIEIQVADDAPGIPRMGAPGPYDTSGRGLMILAALATQWGTVSIPNDGKTVWARFSTAR
jgi:two-component sensor histidine kinase